MDVKGAWAYVWQTGWIFFWKIIAPSVPEYLVGCRVNQQVHVVVGKSRQYPHLWTKWWHIQTVFLRLQVGLQSTFYDLSLILLVSFPFLFLCLSFLALSLSVPFSLMLFLVASLLPSSKHYKDLSTFMLACSMIFWLLWYPLKPTLDQASTTRKVFIFE